MNKFRFCKKGLITVGVLVSLLFTMPFAASIFMIQRAEDSIFTEVSDTPDKSAILVLGAAAYPTRLSDILQDRVDSAIDLFNAKKSSKIIMSGSQSEAEAMAKYAIGKGVPESSVVLDGKGLDTMSSVVNSEQSGSLIIVSQKYHLPRALFIARYYGIDAVGFASDRRQYVKMFLFKKRELLASSAAIFELLFLNK